jgi:diacylglycerol kinase family enzyme
MSVELERPADLELDGEIVRARRVEFDLLPERLSVCA